MNNIIDAEIIGISQFTSKAGKPMCLLYVVFEDERTSGRKSAQIWADPNAVFTLGQSLSLVGYRGRNGYEYTIIAV